MAEVNNFAGIRNMLRWKTKGDYYLCQLMFRRKDKTTTFSNNQNARLVATYYFYDISQYDRSEAEIIRMCTRTGCRAYINLNLRNDKQVGIMILDEITKRIVTNNFVGVNEIINSINGIGTQQPYYWLVDCDSQNDYDLSLSTLTNPELRPISYTKIVHIIPTYSGVHILTGRFDRKQFRQISGLKIDIFKDSPTALYYPNKHEIST